MEHFDNSANNKIQELQSLLQEQRLINEGLIVENRLLHDREDELIREINHIKNTRSWKLTEGLRKCGHVIKGKREKDSSPRENNEIEGKTREASAERIKPSDNDLLSGQNSADIIDCKISVIIPTYNGGNRFEELLHRLSNQHSVSEIEIIVVDSGSSDATLEVAKAHNAKIIHIPHEMFSHSFARNVGAISAEGQILVFMTQDALPDGELWLYKLCCNVYEGMAAASSCTESVPEETDEYYKIGAYSYELFRGIEQKKSVVGELDGTETKEELRKKASLSDIATAIDAKIFKKFYYRYNFAEDLDLGVRLLQNGYRIALLGNAAVIHGHDRNAEYYLKRWFSETRALHKIFGESSYVRDLRYTSSRVFYLIKGVEFLFAELEKKISEDCAANEYFDMINSTMEQYIKNATLDKCENTSNLFDSVTISWCLNKLHEGFVPGPCDRDGYSSLGYFVREVMVPYYKKNKITTIDRQQDSVIRDCIIKQTAGIIGGSLACLTEDAAFYPELIEKMSGV